MIVENPPDAKHPTPWHVHKSNTNSSKRTRAAHFSYEFNNRQQLKLATSNARKRAMKEKKQYQQLLPVFLPTHLCYLAVDRSVIESNTVVIDGGRDNNQQLTPPSFCDPKFPWHCF